MSPIGPLVQLRWTTGPIEVLDWTTLIFPPMLIFNAPFSLSSLNKTVSSPHNSLQRVNYIWSRWSNRGKIGGPIVEYALPQVQPGHTRATHGTVDVTPPLTDIGMHESK